MREFAKRVFGFSLFVSIIFLILGIFLVFRTEGTINLISSIIGVLLLANGGITLINYFRNQEHSYPIELIYGILVVIAGFVLILNPIAIVSVLPFVLGVYFIISGAMKLKYVLDIKNNKSSMPIYSLIISILMIVCGILFVINPFSGAIAITQAIGIFLMVYSILDIINYFCIRKDIKMLEDLFK